jgi:hypothetical protein
VSRPTTVQTIFGRVISSVDVAVAAGAAAKVTVTT